MKEIYCSGEKDYESFESFANVIYAYQLQKPSGLMSAKGYKTKIVEPLTEKLKTAIREIISKYYDMRDSYYSLSGRIERLRNENDY